MFSGAAKRILGSDYDIKFREANGDERITLANVLAEEIAAIFGSTEPIDLAEPLRFTWGGTGPAIIINNDGPSQEGVQITNNDGDTTILGTGVGSQNIVANHFFPTTTNINPETVYRVYSGGESPDETGSGIEPPGSTADNDPLNPTNEDDLPPLDEEDVLTWPPGSFPQPYTPGQTGTGTTLYAFQLNADFYKGAGATSATLLNVGGTVIGSAGVSVSLDAAFIRGYFFQNDYILGTKVGNTYYAIGTGSYHIRGALDGALASGGNQTITTAAAGTVTVYEVLGLDESIASGSKVIAGWSDESEQWEVSAAECA